MRILLDTCEFLWLVASDSKLSPALASAVRDPQNQVFLSAVLTHPRPCTQNGCQSSGQPGFGRNWKKAGFTRVGPVLAFLRCNSLWFPCPVVVSPATPKRPPATLCQASRLDWPAERQGKTS